MRKGKQKSTEKTRDTWYELDNAATVFPSISGDDNTNVFRLACELKESVDGRVLQQALDIAIKSFPYFQVVMRRGLFWFYLERTTLHPQVQVENERPCNRLFYKHVKELLFRVTYFQSRINLEVFHAVSDGTGAFDFLRAIVYHYLVLLHRGELPEELPPLDRETPPTLQAEDSFRHYYNPSEKASPFKDKAYAISGTMLPSGSIRVICATIPTASMLALAKSKGATITAYMATLMICAIHQEMMPNRAMGRTINVMIPVDLRSYFASETTRNFFTVVDIGYNFGRDGEGFDQVLESVSAQMREKITPGSLSGRLSYNMAMQRNMLSRFTPLFIKNPVLRAAYHRAQSTSTCALSNLGRVNITKPFDQYIDHFSCMLNPTRQHRWKACVCSFGDKFVINFTSCIAETKLPKYFLRHLSEAGIDVCVTCNGGAEDEIL